MTAQNVMTRGLMVSDIVGPGFPGIHTANDIARLQAQRVQEITR